MYKKMVDYLSKTISESLNLESQEKALFSFGLELVVGVILEAIILLILAYFLKIFWPVLIALINFLIIRPYAGGIHLPSYNACLLLTLVVFLFIGFITSKLQVSLPGIIILILSISLLGSFLLYKYAPADTKTIPITDPHLRQNLKKKAFIVLTAWTSLAITSSLLFTAYLPLVLASALGILAQLISTHPIFFYLLETYWPEQR
ncbi:MAG TPA: accessory gene regulator B family protein [Halanaerobiaceae bacterium]|nr:accessory gene regulator B family protein [Halanaerobiaceae bacterium]